MSQHSSAAFNHSCLKVPVNPSNKLPAPAYEQKFINQLKNQTLKDNSISGRDTPNMKTNKAHFNSKYKALIDFYDSIPDYSDVNHLSNAEFYRKLEALKAKQKCYYELLETEINIADKADNFVDEYKESASGRHSSSAKSKQNLPVKSGDSNLVLNRATPETESLSSFSKEIAPAPPSRRSVRIESPKSNASSETRNIDTPKSHSPIEKSWRRNIGSAGSKLSDSSKFMVDSVCDEDKDYCDAIDDILKDNSVGTRSLPNSPTKTKNPIVWNDCGITIPKPFKMTVRFVHILFS